ncbi:hypothetical protein ACFQL0_08990 [Haloplanus litoreus]
MGGGTATDARAPHPTVGARRRGALCRRLGLSRREIGVRSDAHTDGYAHRQHGLSSHADRLRTRRGTGRRRLGGAVAYEPLSAEQRETFTRARNGSAEDFDYAWHDIDVVADEGVYYRADIVVCWVDR